LSAWPSSSTTVNERTTILSPLPRLAACRNQDSGLNARTGTVPPELPTPGAAGHAHRADPTTPGRLYRRVTRTPWSLVSSLPLPGLTPPSACTASARPRPLPTPGHVTTTYRLSSPVSRQRPHVLPNTPLRHGSRFHAINKALCRHSRPLAGIRTPVALIGGVWRAAQSRRDLWRFAVLRNAPGPGTGLDPRPGWRHAWRVAAVRTGATVGENRVST
jgi:hypothetical protein